MNRRRRPPLSYRIRQAVERLGERLAAFGAALVWPFERTGQLIGRLLFGASERLERADSIVVGLLKLVALPFRLVWRLLAAIGGAVLPRGARERMAAAGWRLGRVPAWMGGGVWSLLEKLNLDRVVLWIVWIAQPVWRPVAAVLGFLYAWLATRNYRGLVWGIPAVVLLLPVIAAAAWGFIGRSSTVEAYKVAVKEAREAKDYNRLRLYELKLARLGVDTRRTDFMTARALGEQGKVEEAYERMQRLAPEEGPGFLAAHAWIVQHLLVGKIELEKEERVRLAEVHLKHLKTLGVRGAEIDLLEATRLAQAGELEASSEAFAPLIDGNPYAAMERLRIDLTLKRMDEAKKDAVAVRYHMQDAKRREAELGPAEYQAWAAAEELLGDLDAWVKVVREWQAKTPDDPVARQAVASVDLKKFNSLLMRRNPNPQEMADTVAELVSLAPNLPEAQSQVIEMYRRRGGSPALRKMFEILIASPETPVQLVDAIGTAAALSGEPDLSRQLLAKVVEAQPENAVAWNNYGWALSQEPGADFEKALQAANRALELAPDEFRFRETRGQILVGLGRWQEAVEDLEFALNGMPEADAIHVSLAKAYEALGEKELAERHRGVVGRE